MTNRTLIWRISILAFIALVGFSIVFAIRYESFVGLGLALISLGAGIHFLYLLKKARNALSRNDAEEIV